MKALDYIANLLFAWTLAICGASFMVILGIPWSYALAHTLTACIVGAGISLLLMNVVEYAIKRKWPTLMDPDRLGEADAAKSTPQ